MTLNHNPVQIAYFVNDIRKAARRMSSITGAGPFYVIENIELEWSIHRNKPCSFVHSSAYGQWGNIMLELVQQEGEGPSPFRDIYKAGEEGVHHIACFVDSIDETILQYEEMGFPLATRAKAKLGTEFAFIDTSKSLGHMLEIYSPNETLSGFYNLVKEAALSWDGVNIFRDI
jgi:hypothetical protein